MNLLNASMLERLNISDSYEITYIWHQWIRYGLLFSVRNRQDVARDYFAKAIELGELALRQDVTNAHLSHYFLSVIFLYKNCYACYIDDQADDVLASAFQYICSLNISDEQKYIYSCSQKLLTPANHNCFVKAYLREFGCLTSENNAVFEPSRGHNSLQALLGT